MALTSVSPRYTLPDPKAAYRGAQRVAQYRAGEEAFFFPAFPFSQYLPYAALTRVWTQNSQLPLTGCCGKALPIVLLRAEYENAQGESVVQNFQFETLALAEKVLDKIRAARPELFAGTSVHDDRIQFI